jgi:hypothetical protein
MRIEYWPAPNTLTLPTPEHARQLVAQTDGGVIGEEQAVAALVRRVSVTNIRIAVDFFWTVTPCFCTASGNCDSAELETRFCTSTCAKSRSVPILKVTIRL